MAYHTEIYLLIFLPLALLSYQLAPKKLRWLALLFDGYVFFFIISKKLIIFLIVTTLSTYFIGCGLARMKLKCQKTLESTSKEDGSKVKKLYKKKEKLLLAGGIVLLLAIIGYLKYYNFFAVNMNGLLAAAGSSFAFPAKKLLLPIGISFYTLQAISYMVDVYWEKIQAEKHLGKLALFLSFFPQIMEGPISMYSQTADDLWKCESLKGENLTHGCVRILWGLFKKMIIADRLYILVQAVFEHYENHHGVVIAAAAVAYTVQLYMEFSGCMDIVIGTGRMFGITLPENFRQPFASRNAADFWRRWHITLGVWLKTYVFFPVSVSGVVKKWNRFGKKHLGKYVTKLGVSALALFPVWFCNGLWHGPRWSYLFYGMYYFIILLAGAALEPVRNKILTVSPLNENAFYWRIPQTLKTWVIIFVGELFFRANGLAAGIKMFQSMFQNFELRKLWDGTFLTFGLDLADYLAIGIGCAIVAIIGMLKERNLFEASDIQKMRLPVRWAIYYSLILAVIIFGAYGAGYQQVDLIYAGF